MKKTFAILMALVMLVSVIPFAAAADHEHADASGNGICDAEGCTYDLNHEHVDANTNGTCDYPGCSEKMEVTPAEHDHVDANGNEVCDVAGCTEFVHSKHVDSNYNGVCDYPGCTEKMDNNVIGPGADDEDDDDNAGIDHDHTFYGSFKYNTTYHWRQCWCGKKAAKIKHTFYRGECTACGYEKSGYDYDDDGDYRVYLTEKGKGDTDLSARYADRGDIVYIYVDPDKGYEVDDVEVYTTYSSNSFFTSTTRYASNYVNVSKRSNSCYYFRMPAKDVYVEVVYAKDGYTGYDEELTYGAYTDVSSSAWYNSAVNYVTKYEIMPGYSYTKFAPETNLTRATLALALYNISGAKATGSEKFSDVDSNDWYYDAVVWCSNKGIIEGWNGKFDPNGDITREDLAVMLYRYAEYKRLDTDDAEDLDDFTDADDVSSYAVEAVEWAVAEGLINGMGNGTLNPQGTTTRAQAAAVLMRFCKNVA